MTSKRVFMGGDLHCGHRAGLSPFLYNTGINKWDSLRNLLYGAFLDKVNSLIKEKPFDIAVWNGDLIDGRGERSGGTELISSSVLEQCEIASEVICAVGANRNFITRGTPYHTGQLEDYEDIIAKDIDAEKIADQLWLNINGVVFDIKHKIGNSVIPYGRGTAIGRDRIWNLVHNAENEGQPKADIFIRSHVHYFNHVEEVYWEGFILPALQGFGNKFGSRQCINTVHFGFLWFDIEENGDYKWDKWIMKGATQKKEALIL